VDATSASLRREIRRGVLVMPVRRGTFIVADESRSMIQRYAADATSASLRSGGPDKQVLPRVWRGTPVVPAETRGKPFPEHMWEAISDDENEP